MSLEQGVEFYRRKATCQTCPHFCRGQVHIETWCGQHDDQPTAAQNCEAARHGRWQSRLLSAAATCTHWSAGTVVLDGELLRSYRALLRAPCEPPANLSGDGVIYAMFEDNDRADLGVTVGCQLLRELGWTQRIQLWHVGHHPKLPGLDVEIIDARAVRERVGGDFSAQCWGIKAFAIEHSGLERAQWLDWDAYCVANPRPLFAALDAHPMLYWAPHYLWWLQGNKPVHHAVYGLPFESDCPVRPVQGGTYLIDCRRAWRLIRLQRFSDSHPHAFYPPNHNTDEEGWRLAIAATEIDALRADPILWQGPAWWNYYEGTPYVIHRCNSKLWADCIPTWDYDLPLERRVEELHAAAARAGGYGAGRGWPCDRSRIAESREERMTRLRAERRAWLGPPTPA